MALKILFIGFNKKILQIFRVSDPIVILGTNSHIKRERQQYHLENLLSKFATLKQCTF